MHKRNHVRGVLIAAGLGLVLNPGVSFCADEADQVMHEIFDAVAYLLPLSLRAREQSSDWDKELIDQKLGVLANSSDALVKHAQQQEAEFRLLARSFEQTAADVIESFADEWPEFAYFSLMELTQHCVACHGRLSSSTQTEFGQRMMARMNIDELEPKAVAQLYVATRQFDAALATLEQIAMDPGLEPVDADYSGVLIDYLTIAIAVDRSLDRAKTFLRKYAERPDMPYYLEHRISFWIKSMGDLERVLRAEPDFDTARSIFQAADGLTRAPGGRVRAVHDLVASSILRTWIARHSDASGEKLAEAYYILGVIALRTHEPKPFVPEMELLLAAAIRSMPRGPYAEQAYLLLEEHGYVREDHLADRNTTQTLIDMKALRAMIGLDRP